MRGMLRAVLFDMDGVLIHSEDAWYGVMASAAGVLGCVPLSRADFDSSFGQGIEADAVRFYGGVDPAALEAAYARLYPDHIDAVRLDPHARPALDAVRARGLGTAIVTNSPRAAALAVTARHRIEVDVLLTATDVEREKPAPDLVLGACERLGVVPGDALVVGDSVYDGMAARAAGARFVGLGEAGPPRLPALDQLAVYLDGAMGMGGNVDA